MMATHYTASPKSDDRLGGQRIAARGGKSREPPPSPITAAICAHIRLLKGFIALARDSIAKQTNEFVRDSLADELHALQKQLITLRTQLRISRSLGSSRSVFRGMGMTRTGTHAPLRAAQGAAHPHQVDAGELLRASRLLARRARTAGR